jgi:hypothetical protein
MKVYDIDKNYKCYGDYRVIVAADSEDQALRLAESSIGESEKNRFGKPTVYEVLEGVIATGEPRILTSFSYEE